MRAVIQRVQQASVTVQDVTVRDVSVQDNVVGSIGHGFLILLGVTHTDGEAQATYLARKIAGLRLFEDDAGKMNLSLADVGGEVLVVSQFTLYGDVRKGRRPSFVEAARPDIAAAQYELFCSKLRAEGIAVQQGIFRAHMHVSLINDGPVTLWLDTDSLMNNQ